MYALAAPGGLAIMRYVAVLALMVGLVAGSPIVAREEVGLRSGLGGSLRVPALVEGASLLSVLQARQDVVLDDPAGVPSAEGGSEPGSASDEAASTTAPSSSPASLPEPNPSNASSSTLAASTSSQNTASTSSDFGPTRGTPIESSITQTTQLPSGEATSSETRRERTRTRGATSTTNDDAMSFPTRSDVLPSASATASSPGLSSTLAPSSGSDSPSSTLQPTNASRTRMRSASSTLFSPTTSPLSLTDVDLVPTLTSSDEFFTTLTSTSFASTADVPSTTGDSLPIPSTRITSRSSIRGDSSSTLASASTLPSSTSSSSPTLFPSPTTPPDALSFTGSEFFISGSISATTASSADSFDTLPTVAATRPTSLRSPSSAIDTDSMSSTSTNSNESSLTTPSETRAPSSTMEPSSTSSERPAGSTTAPPPSPSSSASPAVAVATLTVNVPGGSDVVVVTAQATETAVVTTVVGAAPTTYESTSLDASGSVAKVLKVVVVATPSGQPPQTGRLQDGSTALLRLPLMPALMCFVALIGGALVLL